MYHSLQKMYLRCSLIYNIDIRMIKILEDFDINPIFECYKKLESDIQWEEYPNGKQTGLQYRTDGDPWKDAVGTSINMIRGSWDIENNLNPYFKNTIFEEIITKYKLIRTRLMWAKPFSCYSMHRDDSPRFHIPIITNTDAYFVFKKDGLIHLSTGHAYWIDTRKFHTVMNCSKDWRLHLVGAYKS